MSGDYWHETEEAQRWPYDAPLSENGILEAKEMGATAKTFAEQANEQFHVVVASPYMRCVQTAVEIVKVLGPETRLLIDATLGEIYGPNIMGNHEPSSLPVRAQADLVKYCKSKGVNCRMQCLGEWPVWGEDVRRGQIRFTSRFLTYLQRSFTARQNFLLVTHADGVHSALNIMPSQVGFRVDKVEHGGMMLAVRRIGPQSTAARSHCNVVKEEDSSEGKDPQTGKITPGFSATSGMTSKMPSAGSQEDADEDDDLDILDMDRRAWATQESSGSEGMWSTSEASAPSPSSWSVQVHRVSRSPSRSHCPETLSRRVRNVADHSHFTSRQISELLLGKSCSQDSGEGPRFFDSQAEGEHEDFVPMQQPPPGRLRWVVTRTTSQTSNEGSCATSTLLFGGCDDESNVDLCDVPSVAESLASAPPSPGIGTRSSPTGLFSSPSAPRLTVDRGSVGKQISPSGSARVSLRAPSPARTSQRSAQSEASSNRSGSQRTRLFGGVRGLGTSIYSAASTVATISKSGSDPKIPLTSRRGSFFKLPVQPQSLIQRLQKLQGEERLAQQLVSDDDEEELPKEAPFSLKTRLTSTVQPTDSGDSRRSGSQSGSGFADPVCIGMLDYPQSPQTHAVGTNDKKGFNFRSLDSASLMLRRRQRDSATNSSTEASPTGSFSTQSPSFSSPRRRIEMPGSQEF